MAMFEISPLLDPSRVFHWGYVVRNIARSLKTWERQGAQVIVPPTFDPIQNVYCALLLWQGAVAIELVAPEKGDQDSPVKNRLAKGGGFDHVCFFVDDLGKATEAQVAMGAIVSVEPCYGVVFDRNLAFLQTKEGVTLELMTYEAVGKASVDPLFKYFEDMSLY